MSNPLRPERQPVPLRMGPLSHRNDTGTPHQLKVTLPNEPRHHVSDVGLQNDVEYHLACYETAVDYVRPFLRDVLSYSASVVSV